MNDLETKTKRIRYELIYPQGERFTQELELHSDTLTHDAPETEPPEWAKLDYHQCDICPLSTKSHTYCPLAMRLVPLCELPDIEPEKIIEVRVQKENVNVIHSTSAQNAYRSLLGLIMATSGCPHTAFFKPMAWFHVPFSDREETMFRACATFLLYQFFNPAPPGERSYFSDLEAVYTDIKHVNHGIGERLHAANAGSSTLNAILILDLFATSILPKLRDSLSEMAFLFDTP